MVASRRHRRAAHRALSFDPTGPRLATGSAAGDASIWDIPSGTRTRHLREIGEPINAVAFSPNGQLVATGGGDGTEQIWQATSGALQSQLNAFRSKILTIEFTASCSGRTCSFNASASTSGVPITNYHWDFDDETTADVTTTTATHVYAYGATFHVHLTVTDLKDDSNGITHNVVVP